MYERLVVAALDAYGIEYETILAVQKGYRNEIYPIQQQDGVRLQLTFYKSEPGIKERIERADRVSSHAAHNGLPARTRADARTLVFTSLSQTVYAGLYYYLPGETIAWEAYTKNHLKQLGKTLSDLHATLQSFDSTGQSVVIDEMQALTSRMSEYFGRNDVRRALQDKLHLALTRDTNRFTKLLEKTRQLPARQLHMDFVRGNILFEDGQVSGILDFEKTAFGPILFDVARTLAFLLVDCKYKTESEVRKYFLQSGYHKRGKLKLEYYPNILDTLVEFFLLHDFYKFLRHNPYESLNDNEHFTRTVTILTRGGVLNYT